MVGDNDAGAFSTYGQAGQNYGTHAAVDVRAADPGAVREPGDGAPARRRHGVGHARLILERFGRFWGAFSVIDLFLLNALTIVTEFIGITLAAGYLGVPKVVAVVLAALVIVGSAMTGSFRRFERIAMVVLRRVAAADPGLPAGPPACRADGRAASWCRRCRAAAASSATVMLLIIGIVGTTVAPWQLFFQQSYVIDKRITPRFIRYEKADLVIGIGVVIVGGAAIMGATAAAFAGTRGAGALHRRGRARGRARPPTRARRPARCSPSRCWTPR